MGAYQKADSVLAKNKNPRLSCQTREIPKFTIKNLAVKVPYQMIEEMWGKSSELNTVNLYTKV